MLRQLGAQACHVAALRCGGDAEFQDVATPGDLHRNRRGAAGGRELRQPLIRLLRGLGAGGLPGVQAHRVWLVFHPHAAVGGRDLLGVLAQFLQHLCSRRWGRVRGTVRSIIRGAAGGVLVRGGSAARERVFRAVGSGQADIVWAWTVEHRQAGDRGELAQLAARDDEHSDPGESSELVQCLQRTGYRSHVGGGVRKLRQRAVEVDREQQLLRRCEVGEILRAQRVGTPLVWTLLRGARCLGVVGVRGRGSGHRRAP